MEVRLLFQVGDKIVHPMHGAGIVESIVQKKVNGVMRDYYVLKLPVRAMVVDDAAKDLVAEGGVAEKAGAVTAVAVDKVHTTVDKAKPVVSEAAKKTGEVVNKGAYATGKQIAATKGMFSGFKEEYDKARGVKPGSDDQALAVTDEAEDEGVSAPAKPASTAPKKKTTAKKPAPKKNMFAAFKEEYDKARHDD